MRLGYELDDDEEQTGALPWALGEPDPDPFDLADDDGIGEADGWLDDQLARRGANGTQRDDPGDDSNGAPQSEAIDDGWSGGGEVVLRRAAPTRGPRRRRADPQAVGDVPAGGVPGYVRDRRGTWRYAATRQAVPGARDLTLRSLYRFPVHQGHVQIPVDLVRSEAELGWCMTWKHTLTTRLAGRRSVAVLRVPVDEWERRADVPFGLWAPELAASRLLSVGDVARLAGVATTTITAYLSRGRMPDPVVRLGNTPLWSRPVIRHWLASRPGQGRPTRR